MTTLRAETEETMGTEGNEVVSASVEFGRRVLWTVSGIPIDGRKPAALGECCVLGCDKRAAAPSAFCSERHDRAKNW